MGVKYFFLLYRFMVMTFGDHSHCIITLYPRYHLIGIVFFRTKNLILRLSTERLWIMCVSHLFSIEIRERAVWIRPKEDPTFFT